MTTMKYIAYETPILTKNCILFITQQYTRALAVRYTTMRRLRYSLVRVL